MYVCKVIGKIISTVKNEKLVGHSIVLVQAAALNDQVCGGPGGHGRGGHSGRRSVGPLLTPCRNPEF